MNDLSVCVYHISFSLMTPRFIHWFTGGLETLKGQGRHYIFFVLSLNNIPFYVYILVLLKTQAARQESFTEDCVFAKGYILKDFLISLKLVQRI